MTKTRPQRTLRREVAYSGLGLHSGKEVTLRFVPMPPHSGIVFQRVDLAMKPIIPATIEYVVDTSRSTTLGVGSATVQTVEHVLASLFAHGIDNVCIQINAAETPAGDGSSNPFVAMIEEAGIEEQEEHLGIGRLSEPVFFSKGDCHLVALPDDHFRISYTLHYPKTEIIRSQYYSTIISPDTFKKDICSARTFALYEEITALMERGLIRGGSLENAVVIKDDAVFSKEGLRYPDEMVRHKILDLVGDLALVGFHFLAHVIAIRSGHHTNVKLGEALLRKISRG